MDQMYSREDLTQKSLHYNYNYWNDQKYKYYISFWVWKITSSPIVLIQSKTSWFLNINTSMPSSYFLPNKLLLFCFNSLNNFFVNSLISETVHWNMYFDSCHDAFVKCLYYSFGMPGVIISFSSTLTIQRFEKCIIIINIIMIIISHILVIKGTECWEPSHLSHFKCSDIIICDIILQSIIVSCKSLLYLSYLESQRNKKKRQYKNGNKKNTVQTQQIFKHLYTKYFIGIHSPEICSCLYGTVFSTHRAILLVKIKVYLTWTLQGFSLNVEGNKSAYALQSHI